MDRRERLSRFLAARYPMRLHMSLILASTCLVGMTSSWALLNAGILDMRLRYPVVLVIAYLAFLLGVWVWLRAGGFARSTGSRSSLADGADLPDLSGGSGGGSGGGALRIPSVGRGGGTFDGGGASASWAQGGEARVLATGTKPAFKPGGAALDGIDLDGDSIVLILLALALVLAVFVASGYLIWMAPDILTEAAFGTMLAGGLARPTRNQSAAGWLAGVVKKTWWPFAIVLAVALAFAFYSAAHFPEANTFRQAVALALH